MPGYPHCCDHHLDIDVGCCDPAHTLRWFVQVAMIIDYLDRMRQAIVLLGRLTECQVSRAPVSYTPSYLTLGI
jgi:hypothetical protein